MRITNYDHRQDFERLLEINDACYSGVYRPPRETVNDMIMVSDVFVVRYADGCARPEDIMVGFAIVKNTGRPYIWNIAVDPWYQGQGFGGKLLDEIIKRYTIAGDKEIHLDVNPTNPAQKLYFDYGFRVKSVCPKYFDPNDGLHMVRPLP
jgi:ribosomal protein S18 acetylase RimI-like enzyme